MKGYRQVADTKYWYNDDSISITDSSMIFKGVAVLDDGYMRFMAETDCESMVLIKSGVEFDNQNVVVTEIKERQVQEKNIVKEITKSICSPNKEKNIEGELSIKDAMLVIYKGIINEKWESKKIGMVHVPNEVIKNSDWERLSRKNLLVKPLELVSFVENDNQRKMLLTATIPEQNEIGHNSQVILSAYIFELKGKNWSLISDFPFVASFGVFGTVHSVSKLKIGRNQEAILLESVETQAGERADYTSFFAVVNGKPTKILETEINRSYEGDFSCYNENGDFISPCPSAFGYSTKVTTVLGKSQEWFDIILTQNGTNLVDDKIVPYRTELKFTFNGQLYTSQ